MAIDARFCHICGLRISAEIVSSVHPLYATIDHYVPLCKGGKNNRANRYPAHRWCNNRKEDRLMPLPWDMIACLQNGVMIYLKKAGLERYAAKQSLIEARQRIGMVLLTKEQKRQQSEDYLEGLMRFENEGGACYKYAAKS